MAFELEALVGHLYVAGGRTIKTNPPGALCEVAPKRAARGREVDTFFALVLPSGTIAPNTFYEQMALMAAERYFSNNGSVTAALRDVFNTLNNNLFEHNTSGRKHYEAHMIAAVLRGEDLFVGRAGAGALILRHSGETKTVPPELTNDEALFKPPLGVQPIPTIEMSRFSVDSGTRMILADANIAEITDENITQALVAANIEQVLDDLKTLVTLQIQMVVAEFVPPDVPAMVPAATGQSTAELQAELAAARARSQQANGTLDNLEQLASARRRNTPQSRLKGRMRDWVVTLSRSIGHTFTAIGNLAGKLFGGSASPNQQRVSTAFITTAVIGLPAVVIMIVMLSWVLNIGATAFEECVEHTTQTASTARTIDSGNPTGVIAAWEVALRNIDECNQLRPENTDPTLRSIRREAQGVIDTLTGITRRSASTIYSFPDANLKQMILKGLDIYALDSNRSIVYRLTLREDGMGPAGTHQIIPSMTAETRIESLGTFVGTIVGIDYDEQRDRVVAVDENGVMISCRPLFINQCESQRMLASENWSNPAAIKMWQRNLYILDVGGDQLWRYEPVGTTDNYASPPTEYFRGGIRYELDRAVGFTIGNSGVTRGAVYILYSDGTMTSHISGDPVPFAFSGFREGLDLGTASTQGMYLNDSPIDTGFFFISQPTRTIYETTAAGTFIAAYRVTDESLFERISAIVVDSDQGIVYVASGNSIVAFSKD